MTGRRLFKTIAVLIGLGYCSLLVYQGGVSFNFQESRTAVQVSELSIEPVTKTYENDIDTDSVNITLDDVFISVKTSQNYQHTRLPIILKTWFQLAKNQVNILIFIFLQSIIFKMKFENNCSNSCSILVVFTS